MKNQEKGIYFFTSALSQTIFPASRRKRIFSLLANHPPTAAPSIVATQCATAGSTEAQFRRSGRRTASARRPRPRSAFVRHRCRPCRRGAAASSAVLASPSMRRRKVRRGFASSAASSSPAAASADERYAHGSLRNRGASVSASSAQQTVRVSYRPVSVIWMPQEHSRSNAAAALPPAPAPSPQRAQSPDPACPSSWFGVRLPAAHHQPRPKPARAIGAMLFQKPGGF